MLNSTQFSYLVDQNSIGAPPLSANFTLYNYANSPGETHYVDFTANLSPGFYTFVNFNRGGNGTIIDINTLLPKLTCELLP